MIVVVGAGIAGLATAVALQRQGHEVSVLDAAPQPPTLGSFLILWPNIPPLLDELGVLTDLQRRSADIRRLVLRDGEGRRLLGMDVSHETFPPLFPLRADLHAVLLGRAQQGTVRWGAPVRSVGRRGVELEDGERIAAELVIDAAGVSSRLAPSRGVHACGYAVTWGRTQDPSLDLEPGLVTMRFGRGRRFVSVARAPGDVEWQALANEPTPPPRLPEPELRACLQAQFADWPEPVGALLAGSTGLRRTVIRDRLPRLRPARGAFTRVGDALRTSTPELGQGACLGLEDAVVLARFIDEHGPTPAALRAFERKRLGRGVATVLASRWVARINQSERPWLGDLRDRGAALVPDAVATAGFGAAASVLGRYRP